MDIQENITIALYYEHMQRTGHDAMEAKHIECDVCLFLKPVMQHFKEKEEMERLYECSEFLR